jgi:Ca2+-binding RTX toxin-like protein
MRLKTVLAGSAVLAWTVLAQPALGATVELSYSTNDGEMHLVYKAAVGEINNVSIIEAPRGVYMITDLNAAITPLTTGCVSISPNSVRCDGGFPNDDPIVFVHTEDGADTVEAETGRNIDGYGTLVDGGDGPDTLTATRFCFVEGGPGDDRLIGRQGQQYLSGGEGTDSLDGGLDNDHLRGGAGPDVMAGGPGEDHVSYDDHTAAVRISLDGRANDGKAGEGDWVRADVEGGHGSRGPTTFIGNAGPNYFSGSEKDDVIQAQAGDDSIRGFGGRDLLSGGAGNDEIIGSYGADVIRGGAGNDLLLGERGSDDLSGGAGHDRLSGGRESDTLRGGPGRDRLSGNGSPDILYARDRNRDRLSGGGGRDRARVDSIDELFSIEVLF